MPKFKQWQCYDKFVYLVFGNDANLYIELESVLISILRMQTEFLVHQKSVIYS